jgi:hypothetical protein
MADINPRAHEYQEYRHAIRELCGQFDNKYWQGVEERAGYPDAFVKALTDAGWLAALIPEQYGGGGLNITEASVILEEINRSGANSGACHAQMYVMGALLRHGSDAQKQKYLPAVASGELRLQSFAVTEPTTGTDTTKTRTTAARKGDRYVVNGQKVWISRIQHSDLMLLLARTTPLPDVKKKTEGMSIFLVDLRGAEHKGMTVRPIRNMVNHETNEVFFEDFEVLARQATPAHSACLADHRRSIRGATGRIDLFYERAIFRNRSRNRAGWKRHRWSRWHQVGTRDGVKLDDGHCAPAGVRDRMRNVGRYDHALPGAKRLHACSEGHVEYAGDSDIRLFARMVMEDRRSTADEIRDDLRRRGGFVVVMAGPPIEFQ